MRAYIDNGWADTVIDPDNGSFQTSSKSSNLEKKSLLPDTSWVDIKEFYKSPDQVPSFNNGQIITYFVSRSLCDSRSCSNFKEINQSAVNLFRCGHLQQVEVSKLNEKLCIQAHCLPKMKKDRTQLFLSITSWDIISTNCRCPAGQGPAATCKHIGALCYLFQNFCEVGTIPEFLLVHKGSRSGISPGVKS